MTRDIVVVLKAEMDLLLAEGVGYGNRHNDDMSWFVHGKLYGVIHTITTLLTSGFINDIQYKELNNYFKIIVKNLKESTFVK